MKKTLALLLALIMLLSLIACAEDIVPSDDKPNDPPVTDEEPEKVIIETKMGTLPCRPKEFDHIGASSHFLSLYPDGITEPVVQIATNKDELNSLIPQSTWDVFTEEQAQTMSWFGSYAEYDEAFFETKKVIAVTILSAHPGIDMSIQYLYSQTDENNVKTYYAKLVVDDYSGFFGEPHDPPPQATTVTIALDKNVDITAENLVFNLVDVRN